MVMFTASGLLVRFLKVFEKSGYQSVKWVRYLSKANRDVPNTSEPTWSSLSLINANEMPIQF